MKRHGFSMIELVFVIVILGVLAAVAVPRFVTTRTDAQVAMLRSDIASTLKAIPARVFAENLDPTASTPDGFSNWGEWMIDTGGLDRGRWVGSGKYINPVVNATEGSYCGTYTANSAVIAIDDDGNLLFNPNNIVSTKSASGNASSSLTLCETLRNSYPSGSNRSIPLATTGAVKF